MPLADIKPLPPALTAYNTTKSPLLATLDELAMLEELAIDELDAGGVPSWHHWVLFDLLLIYLAISAASAIHAISLPQPAFDFIMLVAMKLLSSPEVVSVSLLGSILRTTLVNNPLALS